MLDLTFGEQVKIILSRKGMTIKELAETIEKATGKKMSRQNLTQRLGRDNFQEQDMRMIAEILGCPFHLSILGEAWDEKEEGEMEYIQPTEKELEKLTRKKHKQTERDITIGELVDIHKELDELMEERQAEEMVGEQMVLNFEEPVETEPENAAEAVEELEETAEESIIEQMEESAEEPQEVYVEEPEEFASQEETGAEPEEPVTEEEESPEEVSVEELLAEVEEPVEEEKVPEPEVKKSRGWRDFFQRRRHKEAAPVKEEVPEKTPEETVEELTEEPEMQMEEEPVTEPEMPLYEENDDYIDYESQELEEAAKEEQAAAEEILLSEEDEEEDLERGDVNPYTGHEYETNTVRMHPKRIGYVQVYDRSDHQWTDMTEWAFLGYQERKKALLGKDYEPPIYLD